MNSDSRYIHRRLSTIAVVLAGGSGRRFGGSLPKQFSMIDGRTVLERAVDAFMAAPSIEEVSMVIHPDFVDEAKRIVARNDWPKFGKVILGGEERFHSSLHAVEAYSDCDEDSLLLLHDAARPFVTTDIIEAVVDSMREADAAAVGIPATDTVWMASSGDGAVIDSIPLRSCCYHAQTPQAFRLWVLRKAYSLALSDSSFVATDDCGAVHRYLPEVPIRIVQGSPINRKITFPSDI